MADRRAQLIAPLLVLAALVVVSLIHLVDPSLYSLVLSRWGDYPEGLPFVDLRSVLNQLECNRAGIAVIDAARAGDACGVYNYSPLLLTLPVRIDPAAATPIALALCVLFAVSLGVLPVRAAPRDIAIMMLAVLSGAVTWALASANVDLIIFELALVVSALMCLRGKARFAAYVVALTAGMLKYYPVVLMGHALTESRRVFLLLLAVSAAAAALFIALFHHQLAASLQLLPAGSVFRGRWGAQILPLGIEWLVSGDKPGAGAWPMVPVVGLGALLALALGAMLWQARRPAVSGALASLPPWPRSLLISGALVVVGCFAAWQNLPFRGIFLLLVLPGLLMLERSGLPSKMPLLVLFLLWQGPLSQGVLHLMMTAGASEAVAAIVQVGIWMATQLIWWWVVVILGAILYGGLAVPFVRGSRGWNAKGA